MQNANKNPKMGRPRRPTIKSTAVVEIRKARGETQALFAFNLNCTVTTVSKFERLQQLPTGRILSRLKELAAEKGLTVEQFEAR